MLVKIKKAQSTLEYVLLIAVVIGALVTMQSYMKRGLQGKLKESTDSIGDQYTPGLTIGTYHMYTNSETTENYRTHKGGGSFDVGGNQAYFTETVGTQLTDQTQDIHVLADEWWPGHP